MYRNFYNLTALPFHITPDPKFLYLSPSHKEAFASIVYGIEQRKGFISIIGAVGVGKTTILRSYLQRTERTHVRMVYVFNAALTYMELLRTVCREFDLGEGGSATEMTHRLYEFLIDEYQKGNTVVLVIDEAQNMPVETLESLRMLSNFETPDDKLIQIVLVGQPELADLLKNERLRSLDQRIAVRSTILPLTKAETAEYIGFRLSRAGVLASSVFAPSALNMIVETSKGIPRTVNILCDNALITGFGYKQRPVGRKIIREVIRDFKGVRLWPLVRWWLGGALASLALFFGGVLFLSSEKGTRTKIVTAPAIAQATPAYVVPEQNRLEKAAPERAAHENRNVSGPAQKAMESAPPAENRAPTRRVVSRGDNLSRLAEEIYGYADADLLSLIRKENPQIANPNVILAGSMVTFPAVNRTGGAVRSRAGSASPGAGTEEQ